jgi:hypothetical protein
MQAVTLEAILRVVFGVARERGWCGLRSVLGRNAE